MSVYLYKMNRVDFCKAFIENETQHKIINIALNTNNNLKLGDIVLIFLNDQQSELFYYGIYATIMPVILPNKFKVLNLTTNNTPILDEIEEYINNETLTPLNNIAITYGRLEHKALTIYATVKQMLLHKININKLEQKEKDYLNNEIKNICKIIIKNFNIPNDIKTAHYVSLLFEDIYFWLDYKNKTFDDFFKLANKTELSIRNETRTKNNNTATLLTQELKCEKSDNNINIETDVLIFEARIFSNKKITYKGIINGEIFKTNSFYDDLAEIQNQFDKANKIVSIFCYAELYAMMKQGLSINDDHLLFDLSYQFKLHKKINGFVDKLESKNRDRLLEIMKTTYKVHEKNKYVSLDLIRRKMSNEEINYIKNGDTNHIYDNQLFKYLKNDFVKAVEYNERMPYDDEFSNLKYNNDHFVNFSIECKDKFWLLDDKIGKLFFKQSENFIDNLID